MAKIKAQKDLEESKVQHEKEKWQHEIDLAIIKEEEKRKTEVVKGALVGASFNPDQDVDKDGINDYLEIARHGLDADVKRAKVDLDVAKFQDNH